MTAALKIKTDLPCALLNSDKQAIGKVTAWKKLWKKKAIKGSHVLVDANAKS